MTAVHKKAPKSVHGISIGGMVFLLHLVGVPLTGASMNPARSFAPATCIRGCWFVRNTVALLGSTNYWWNNCWCYNELCLCKKS